MNKRGGVLRKRKDWGGFVKGFEQKGKFAKEKAMPEEVREAISRISTNLADRIRQVIERNDQNSPLILANIGSANPQFSREIVVLVNFYQSV